MIDFTNECVSEVKSSEMHVQTQHLSTTFMCVYAFIGFCCKINYKRIEILFWRRRIVDAAGELTCSELRVSPGGLHWAWRKVHAGVKRLQSGPRTPRWSLDLCPVSWASRKGIGEQTFRARFASFLHTCAAFTWALEHFLPCVHWPAVMA